MADTPMLVGDGGALAGRQWTITPEGLRLGREAENEVHIDDPAVSRQHARVLLHNGSVWVQDAGSRNGVFVNGERVADSKQVKPGDRVVVGTHAFRIAVSGARLAPTVAVAATPAPRPAKKGSLVPYVLIGMVLVLLGGLLLTVALVAAGAFGLFG